jgi:hypothetical protein
MDIIVNTEIRVKAYKAISEALPDVCPETVFYHSVLETYLESMDSQLEKIASELSYMGSTRELKELKKGLKSVAIAITDASEQVADAL